MFLRLYIQLDKCGNLSLYKSKDNEKTKGQKSVCLSMQPSKPGMVVGTDPTTP